MILIQIPQNIKKKHLKKQQAILEKQQQQQNTINDVVEKSYNVPDRVTGREAVKELPSDRQWNFIEVCLFKIGNAVESLFTLKRTYHLIIYAPSK